MLRILLINLLFLEKVLEDFLEIKKDKIFK